jgi:secreted PhoX family phosphatase
MPTLKDLLDFYRSEPDSKDHVRLERTFQEVLKRRVARRTLLKGTAASLPFVVLGLEPAERAQAAAADGLTFQGITLDDSDSVTVPNGYVAENLIRWGDPVEAGAPAFDPENQTPEAQAMQFGYNCDFLGWFELPFGQGIVTVNHEYTNEELMFPNYDAANPTADQVNIAILAHGASIVHVHTVTTGQNSFRWAVASGSGFNRRITGETEMEITGPLAGHALMRTSEDASGTKVRGMFNNCGGGMTPWGTLLTAEENFDQYFANNAQVLNDSVRQYNSRLGVGNGASFRKWEMYHSRFDLAQEPNEMNRFGYMVEIDPYDPTFVPKKRTALGRFKHEAASIVVTPSGKVAVYSGDDARFEYVYKFVSEGVYDPKNRKANFELMDSGTLYAAKFNEDGTGEWLPLVFGENGLTPANGFANQGEVLLKARFAADELGATPMDRPEDIEWNPANDKVYVALTNNSQRGTEGNGPLGQNGPTPRAATDAMNPRTNNRWGHIIEILPEDGDHAAETFTWEMFLVCGDPGVAEQETYFAGFDPSRVSPIGCPDNVAFDRRGNLWIATDGLPSVLPGNDGIFAVPTEGPDRGYLRQFLSGVKGCEVAALVLNRQNNTLFVAIQHPGEGGTYEEPISNYPDGSAPVRPTVVAVTKTTGPGFRIGT